jgi:hypothetical protein
MAGEKKIRKMDKSREKNNIKKFKNGILNF